MSLVMENQPTRRPVLLKREIGLTGLLWASVASIIGSGRLYGPLDVNASPAGRVETCSCRVREAAAVIAGPSPQFLCVVNRGPRRFEAGRAAPTADQR